MQLHLYLFKTIVQMVVAPYGDALLLAHWYLNPEIILSQDLP